MILVTGATGFIGSNLMKALKENGQNAKCLVRSPKSATRCSSLGFSSVSGSVTDRESLKGSLDGVDAVVHLVGIIEERGQQTFQKVHSEGTSNIIDEAIAAGVKHFVYVSAIGADAASPFPYARTKAQAENAVRASGIPHTILRPSLVIGPRGGFVEKMLELVNFPGPFMPVPGDGKTKFQPIFVNDLAKCIMIAIENPEARDMTYEIGGPEQLAYNDLLRILSEVTGRRKTLIHIPMGLMMPAVRVLEKIGMSPVTSGQLAMLSVDNTCEPDSIRKNFGFDPEIYRRALEVSI